MVLFKNLKLFKTQLSLVKDVKSRCESGELCPFTAIVSVI